MASDFYRHAVFTYDGDGSEERVVAPGGQIVDEIAAPEGLSVFTRGLGGEDGRTLVACAAPDFHEEARSAAREAALLETTVEVGHAGLP